MSVPTLLERRGELWVISKPAGWLVHAAGEDPAPQLLPWAVEHLGAPETLAPIHRLDKQTSGLVLCSGDAATRAQWGEYFAQHELQKTYLALVHGRARRKGIVRKALKDGRRGKPLEAVTRYNLVEWLGPCSLLRLRPETGRKHQLRRHLQGLGHAIVGDDRYPPKRRRAVPGFPGRLWLHASSLEIPGQATFEAPLPPELLQHLELLRGHCEAPEPAPEAS